MKLNGILALGVISLLLTGCATTTQNWPAPVATEENPSKSRFCVVRPSRLRGAIYGIPIYDNFQLVGKVGFDKPLCWERDPGSVYISSTKHFSWDSGANIYAKGGFNYNFVAQMNFDNSASLWHVDETTGERLVAKGGLSDIILFIVTDPPGAEIDIEGVYQGKSPAVVTLRSVNPGSSKKLSIAATPAALDHPSLGFLCGHSLTDSTISPTPEKDLDVTLVYPGSQAHAMGLRAGDRIRQVNRKAVENGLQMAAAIRQSGFGGDVELLVDRAGKEVLLLGRTHAQNQGHLHRREKEYRAYELYSMNLQTIYFNLK